MTTTTQLQLSNTTVDYDAIDAAFVADLQQVGSWSELLPSATGSSIRRWMSSVAAFSAGGTARALQEIFPDTARTPGGVFRAQRIFQGGGIIRRRAGLVAVVFSRTDTLATDLTVPAYTQFSASGVQYFNRTAFVVPASGQATVDLYQGTIETQAVTVDGTPYARYVVGTPDLWDASNDDIYATDSAGATWTSTAGGLWQQGGSAQVFRASTMPSGTIECRFGDGTYGSVPPAGTLTFTYASLLPAAQTLAGIVSGSTVTPQNSAGITLTGATSGAAAPNQDAPPPEFYKAIGPGSASNNGRAVSRQDYRRIALEYDGVVDAIFRGQAETNPGDVRYMNIVQATILTTSLWTVAQWLAFKTYFETEVGISGLFLSRVDPTAVAMPHTITIGATRIADTSVLQTLALGVLATYYTPQAGSLGATVYPSDITLAIAEQAVYQQAPNEAGSLVDYINITVPSGPVALGPTQYPTLDTSRTVVNVVQSTRGQSAASLAGIVGL